VCGLKGYCDKVLTLLIEPFGDGLGASYGPLIFHPLSTSVNRREFFDSTISTASVV